MLKFCKWKLSVLSTGVTVKLLQEGQDESFASKLKGTVKNGLWSCLVKCKTTVYQMLKMHLKTVHLILVQVGVTEQENKDSCYSFTRWVINPPNK